MSVKFYALKIFLLLVQIVLFISALLLSFAIPWQEENVVYPLVAWGIAWLMSLYVTPRYGSKRFRHLDSFCRYTLYLSLTLMFLCMGLVSYLHLTPDIRSGELVNIALFLVAAIAFFMMLAIDRGLPLLVASVKNQHPKEIKIRLLITLASFSIVSIFFASYGSEWLTNIALSIFLSYAVLGYITLSAPLDSIKETLDFKNVFAVPGIFDREAAERYYEQHHRLNPMDLNQRDERDARVNEAELSHKMNVLIFLIYKMIIRPVLSILIAAGVGVIISIYYLINVKDILAKPKTE